MARAIDYCHRHQILHGDVKMENFLLDIDIETNKITLKLSDFGLSKRIRPGELRKCCQGTFVTMAPEVLNVC